MSTGIVELINKQREAHVSEAIEIHTNLARTNVGRFLSEFMSMTSRFKATQRNVSTQGIVLELSRLLLACLSSPTHRQRAGFLDSKGSIPKYILIGEVMGRRVAVSASTPALLREVVACFYGPTNNLYGHSSILRGEIDRMCALGSNDQNISFALVLSAPWGFSLNDRFWRFFSIRKEETLGGSGVTLVDAEQVLVSFQTPPAPPGGPSSAIDYKSVSDADVKSFCTEFKCVCVDEADSCEETAETSKGAEEASKPSEASDRRQEVMKEIINKLKAENASLKLLADECTSKHEEDIDKINVYENERSMLYGDIASYEQSLENHSKEMTSIRMSRDALHTEIASMEDELVAMREQVVSKQGEILVLQDSIEKNKKAKSDDSERLRETLRRTLADLKASQETSNKEKERLKQLESQLESSEAEAAHLSCELERTMQHSRKKQESSSETIARLMDSNSSLENTAKSLKDAVKSLKDTVKANKRYLNERRVHGLKVVARMIRSHIALRAARASRRAAVIRALAAADALVVEKKTKEVASVESVAPVAPVAIETSDQESESAASAASAESTSISNTLNANSPSPMPFPADAVASANRCISSLKNWIEMVENTSQNRTLASPPAHHPPQHSHQNFELDYSNGHSYGPQFYGGHGHAQYLPSHNHSYQQPHHPHHPHHTHPQHQPPPYHHGGVAYHPHQPTFFNHAQYPYDPEPVAVAVPVATNTENCAPVAPRRERRALGRR